MSPRRAPAPPPELDGFTFVKTLGTGGFADVFLYGQRMPRRQVAIKVLAGGAVVSESAREQFMSEADLVAQLSGHSSIVSIYGAGYAADARPYLVMQYCPLPNLSQRLQTRALGVPEALGIGIRMAGAVETAHRAGIVHRDIKPANVLTTEYGRPALADFGIAGLLSAGPETTETIGVSVPWAAPEAVEGESAGVAGDVYSLGATIYTALAGRSPFTVPGGPNARLDYIQRIRTAVVPPIGRDDVPASLTRVLERAMAKQPERRYASALDLGRALQAVELELALPSTEIEVPDTAWMDRATATPDAPDAGGRTVVRKVVEVLPYVTEPGVAEERPEPAPAPSTGGDGPEAPAPDPGRRGRRLAGAVGAVLAVTAGIVVVYGVVGGRPDTPTTPTPSGTGIPVPQRVASPEGLTGERSGESVTFTWRPPEALVGAEGLSYTWQRTEPGAPPQVRHVDDATVTVDDAPGQVCLAVKVRMPDGTTSTEAATACVP